MTRAELIEVAGPEIAQEIMERWGGRECWIPDLPKPQLEERKRKARELRLQGIRVDLIAERLGRSKSTVYSYLEGMPAFDDPAIKRWHGFYEVSPKGTNKYNGRRYYED